MIEPEKTPLIQYETPRRSREPWHLFLLVAGITVGSLIVVVIAVFFLRKAT